MQSIKESKFSGKREKRMEMKLLDMFSHSFDFKNCSAKSSNHIIFVIFFLLLKLAPLELETDASVLGPMGSNRTFTFPLRTFLPRLKSFQILRSNSGHSE